MSKLNPNSNNSKEAKMIDQTHFLEHLKANVPWVVVNKTLFDDKYYVYDKTMVSMTDIKKWRDEKLLYIIEENNKTHSILLRPQFPNNKEIEEEAKFVPI